MSRGREGSPREALRPWQFFRRAWEAGVNFFDTAGADPDGERDAVLGRALKESEAQRGESKCK